MRINISITINFFEKLQKRIVRINWSAIILFSALAMSELAIVWAHFRDVIVAYGDAESHLDIAKRVVSGLTPGFAQLGGIWLPLPHLLMTPLLIIDPLWRTGIGGAIVSGVAYVLSAFTLYKLTWMLTNNRLASFMTFLFFSLNLNILYMQSTPMTELPLVAFSLFSTYFFIKYLREDSDYLSLIVAGLFGFFATLSRYDGWFLVMFEAMIIFLQYFRNRKKWIDLQGKMLLFGTLAFLGIGLWFLWDFLILGDPLYFTHSQFSAKAQQSNWLAKGELPAYKNLGVSLVYYMATVLGNAGVLNFLMACIGMIYFLLTKVNRNRFFISLLLFAPFVFYVITLFVGQSVIFIPSVTPVGFEWRLFNVRYGIVMIPTLAFFFGYLFSRVSTKAKWVIIGLFLFQFVLYGIGYSKVVTYDDGTVGLSAAKRPDAEGWMKKHYDNGLVLLDDYARTMSVIRSGIPMQSVVYIGTKPYWDISLKHPETYATWIVMQKDDSVWKAVYDDPIVRGRLFKYYEKVYTSPEILIFRKPHTKK